MYQWLLTHTFKTITFSYCRITTKRGLLLFYQLVQNNIWTIAISIVYLAYPVRLSVTFLKRCFSHLQTNDIIWYNDSLTKFTCVYKTGSYLLSCIWFKIPDKRHDFMSMEVLSRYGRWKKKNKEYPLQIFTNTLNLSPFGLRLPTSRATIDRKSIPSLRQKTFF